MRKVVNTVVVRPKGSVIQMMTNAVIQDYRGCSSINRGFGESCNLLIDVELHRPYVMEPTNSVQKIVSAFK